MTYICVSLVDIVKYYRSNELINYYMKNYKKVLALIPEFDQEMDKFVDNTAPLYILTSAVSLPDLY